MINVSNNFKKAIKEPIREIDGYVELTVKGSYIGANTEYPESNITKIRGDNLASVASPYYAIDSDPIYIRYASLEPNFFKLDGSLTLPNKNNNKYTGYIGGINEDEITIEVDILDPTTGVLSFTQSENSITIYFDEEYAVDMDVEFLCVYNQYPATGSAISETYTVNITDNNKSIITIGKEEIPKEIESGGQIYKFYGFHSVIITINEWSNPLHRVRIKQINLGETIIYKDSDIIEIKTLEQTDFDNYTMPNDDCSIILNNKDKKFNIIESDNILNRLTSESIIRPFIGCKINGTYEYVSMGSYQYISNVDNNGLDVTLNGIGAVEALEKEFPYVLHNELINVSDMVRGTLGATPTSDLPYGYFFAGSRTNFNSKREQAQAIAVVLQCYKKELRYPLKNVIGLIPMNTYSDFYNITLSNETKYPRFKKIDKVKKINFKKLSLDFRNMSENVLYEEYVSPIGLEWGNYVIRVYVSTSTPTNRAGIKVYVDDILTNNFNVVYSCYNFVFTINVSDMSKRKITITANQGRDIYSDEEIINENVENGAEVEANNPYAVYPYIKSNIQRAIFDNQWNYEFEVETSGDPSLEVCDTIYLENIDGYKYARINYIESKYDGSYSSILKGVCTDEYNK